MAEFDKLRALTGLASMSAKVATVLFRFALEADPLGAGTDARLMAKELSSFSSALTYLVSVLGSTEEQSHVSHCLQLIEPMNRRCLDIFADIVDCPNYPRPLSPISFENLFRWAFDEPEMRLLRVTLESFKITLDLLIATVEQSRKPSSWRQFDASHTNLDQEEREQDGAIIAGLTYTQQASYRDLCGLEEEVNAYGRPGMPDHVYGDLGSANVAFHPPGSQSLIDFLGQTGLELKALRSRWYTCSISTAEHASSEPLAERRTSSLLADLSVKISVLRRALKAISIMKASTRSLVHIKHTLGRESRFSASLKYTHPESLRTMEPELDSISVDWVDLSNHEGTDKNIVPLVLVGACKPGYLVLPFNQCEACEAKRQVSDITSPQSDREVGHQDSGTLPEQEQQEVGISPTTARENKCTLQEALKVARVAVCQESARHLMNAIEKYEQYSQLLKEVEDLSQMQ